jgi:hypothetical protein
MLGEFLASRYIGNRMVQRDKSKDNVPAELWVWGMFIVAMVILTPWVVWIALRHRCSPALSTAVLLTLGLLLVGFWGLSHWAGIGFWFLCLIGGIIWHQSQIQSEDA